jgi:hypothetical protein
LGGELAVKRVVLTSAMFAIVITFPPVFVRVVIVDLGLASAEYCLRLISVTEVLPEIDLSVGGAKLVPWAT